MQVIERLHSLMQSYQDRERLSNLAGEAPPAKLSALYSRLVSWIREVARFNKWSEPREKVTYHSTRTRAPILIGLGCGVTTSTISYLHLGALAAVLAFLLGAYIPIVLYHRGLDAKTRRFAEDYPTLLMSAASSLKAGSPPFLALERAAFLLRKESPLHREVQLLLQSLRAGEPPSLSLSRFGATVELPELQLFRAGFSIALEQGGKFAPTLERLALVTRERLALQTSAAVSTAVMRMTANIILCLAPALMGVVAIRQGNYWQLLFNDPTVTLISTVAISLILTGYILLTALSRFRP